MLRTGFTVRRPSSLDAAPNELEYAKITSAADFSAVRVYRSSAEVTRFASPGA